MSTLATASGVEAVRSILEGLMLRKPEIRKSAPPPAGKPMVIAIYKSADGKLAGVWAASVAFAASAGAALSLVPAALAEEAVRNNRLTGPVEENVREVFNIAGRLFAGRENHRVSLAEIILPPKAPPPEIAKLITAPPARLDIEIDVQGYPAGKATLVFMLP